MSDRSQASRSDTIVVAPGIRVPYPFPASPAATRFGVGNRRRDTKPELALRSALHRMGFRFRKDHPIVAEGLRVRVDVVFPRAKVAVFVDGCFWHNCPEHQRVPKSNPDYWIPKLRANQARDERVTTTLRSAGWTVVRIWEHDDTNGAASTVASNVRRASARPPRPEVY